MNHRFTLRDHLDRARISALVGLGEALQTTSEWLHFFEQEAAEGARRLALRAQRLSDDHNARFVETLMAHRHDPVAVALDPRGKLVHVDLDTHQIVNLKGTTSIGPWAPLDWAGEPGKSEPLPWLGETYAAWEDGGWVPATDYSPDSVKLGYTGDPDDVRVERVREPRD